MRSKAFVFGSAMVMALGFGVLAHAQEAQILTGAKFSHPVLETASLSSAYGVRQDPFTKRPGWHNGIDLAAPLGTPAYLPADGTVIFAGTKAGYGKMVDVQVTGNLTLRYSHLKTIEVSEGAAVTAGSLIGTVGSTGRGAGAHLHFETHVDGKVKNPERLKGLSLFREELNEGN